MPVRRFYLVITTLLTLLLAGCTLDGFVTNIDAPAAVTSEPSLKTLSGNEFPRGHMDGSISQARLWGPIGMTKLNGDYYFTDFYTIRKINMTNPSNPQVETIAGTPGFSGNSDGTGSAAQFNTLTGIATDGTYLYVTDSTNHVIRRVNPATKVVEVFAGTLGTSGDVDGTGTAARMNAPRGIIFMNGDLYFLDASPLIKKVTTAGVVSVVAGTRGTAGYVNSTLLASRFRNMYDLTTDGTNIYVVDSDNRMVRKVDLVGDAVTTLAGGSSIYGNPGTRDGDASQSMLESPMGIAWVNGTLWIAEQNSSVIRRLDLSNPGNPVLTTIIGKAMEGSMVDGFGTAARIMSPRSFYYDAAADEIFVMARHASTISKVNPVSLQVQHWIKPPAGTLSALAGPGGSVVFPRGLVKDGNKVVFTTRTHEIRMLDLTTNSVSTLTGTRNVPGTADGAVGTAQFALPLGIAKYGDGYVVADYYNYSLRYVRADGSVGTLAGVNGTSGTADQAALGSAARFTAPRNLLVVGSTLYVTDSNRIRRVDLPTTDKILVDSPAVTNLVGGNAAGTVCPGITLSAPAGMVVRTESAEPILYFSDTGVHRIRRLNLSTCAITTVAGSGTAGAVDGTGTGINSLHTPGEMVEHNGFLYVASTGSHIIKRMDLTSLEVTTVYGGSTDANQDGFGKSARLYGPNYLSLDGSNLYVSQPNYHQLRQIDLTTGLVSRLSQPLIWGGMEYGVPQNSTDGSFDYYVPYFFSSVKVGSYYYASDIINNVIWRISESGQREVYAGKIAVAGSVDGPRLSARLIGPQGLEHDNGYLYVAELSAHIIRRINMSTGVVTTIVGAAGQAGNLDGVGTAARLTRPGELKIYKGYLYISTHSEGLIYRMNLTTLQTELFAGTVGVVGDANGPRLSSTFNITYSMSAKDDVLYVGDGGNYLVRAIDLSPADTGVTTYLGVSGVSGNVMADKATSTFIYPISMDFEGDKMILVDRQNQMIKLFDPVLNWISSFIGLSSQAGQVDGKRSEARVVYPCTMKKSSNELLITDGQCWNLRVYK